MSSTLKERFFTPSIWAELGTKLAMVIPEFDALAFQQAVCDSTWPALELKQRIRRVAVILRRHLPTAYPDAIDRLVALAQLIIDDASSNRHFTYLFMADFMEEFGLDHLEASMQAAPVITQVMSCEFAVRPFILRYPEAMLSTMLGWASHPNVHVRRLASEGSRPRLPWGKALTFLKKDPSGTLPILQKLKDDPSEYVRRSVSNHLNDISKDHPKVVLGIAQQWIGIHPETDRLLKHALRGMLKAGQTDALALFGFQALQNLAVEDLQCQAQVAIGGEWQFSFRLIVQGKSAQQLRLEFGIDYVKANGEQRRKVFQLREGIFAPGEYVFEKRHSFLERTTRKHHPGRHAVAVLVNGQECALQEFDVA